MNRGYVHEKKLECNFISGSDNHIWSCYPFEDENYESDMVYSYLKVIPTFRGLAIAITGENRIEVSEKLIKKAIIENIEFDVGEKIELSSGINAIIGDNAIGKSVILESIFNSNNLKSYHKNYIEKNGWNISPYTKKDYHYDSQGDIREYFQKSNNKLEAHHTIRKYLKSTFDKDNLEFMVTSYVDGFLKLVEFNTDFEAKKMLLNTRLEIPKYDEYDYLPKFIGILMPESITNISSIIIGLEKTIESINLFKGLLNSEEIVEVDKFIKYLRDLKDQYKNLKEEIIFRNKILNLIISVSEIEKEEMRAYKSVVKQEVDDYRDNYTKIIVDFILVLNTLSKETPFKFSEIKDHVFSPVDNEIGKFKISSQPKKMDYRADYIIHKLLVPLNYINETEKAEKLNVKNFITSLGSGFEKEEKKDYKSYYRDIVLKNFSKDFIIETKLDYTSDLFGSTATSPGINALKYLDIISTDSKLKIVAFDQPEDDVSPTKIGKELSDIIRKMSRNSQIIFVTHNPQLVINLDVDNVVCLTNKDDKIKIDYGGLEYENKAMSIMDLVADNLDGGAEVIRKRWKRYDKFQID
jgi:predicted ATP-dependent endonuclease of OLD family